MTESKNGLLPVVYVPPAAPPASDRGKRSGLRGIFTFFCALSCIVSVTVIFLTALEWCSQFTLREQILAMANRAMLGQAYFVWDTPRTLSDERFPFPAEGENAPLTPAPPIEDISPPETGMAAGYPIQAMDLSCPDLFTFSNETAYSPDGAALLAAPLPFEDFAAWQTVYGGTEEPYILILHTHGTEAYAEEGQAVYTSEESFRTTDIGGNVVAVGAVMADTFEAAGIPTLHCTEMFDRESYSNAYTLSSAAVRKYLSKHPSIRIVLDVHRDSIIRADKTKIRPITKVNGADTAQFMIVAGTDFKGANHPDWQDNLNFALKIQRELTEISDSLCRAVNLRGAGFNQQHTSGSLLLEIGSCGNTLTEAKHTAVWAAVAIADTVTAIPCGITPEDILT